MRGKDFLAPRKTIWCSVGETEQQEMLTPGFGWAINRFSNFWFLKI